MNLCCLERDTGRTPNWFLVPFVRFFSLADVAILGGAYSAVDLFPPIPAYLSRRAGGFLEPSQTKV
jgi:hypothetical protein